MSELHLQDLIFDFEEGGPPPTSTQTPHPPLTVEEENYLQEVLQDFPPLENISPLVENVENTFSSNEDTLIEEEGHSPAPGLYKGDPMVPVYGTFSTSLPRKSIVEIIAAGVDDTHSAKLVPSQPGGNYAFMVDTSFLSNWKDVLSDDFGILLHRDPLNWDPKWDPKWDPP